MLTFSEYVKVGIADYKVVQDCSKGIVTLGLGSCIGICIYESRRKIGGLAHIMLPYCSENGPLGNNSFKYANIAIPLMIEDLINCGCSKYALEAVIIGGANMFQNSHSKTSCNVGVKNQEAVKEILKTLGIKVMASDLGGTEGKTVFFELAAGDVYIKKGCNTEKFYTFNHK